jgi:intergrase/recombinase
VRKDGRLILNWLLEFGVQLKCVEVVVGRTVAMDIVEDHFSKLL